MLLYKYYPPNGNSFDAIENGYFWFSTVKHLNDPYDLNCGKGILHLRVSDSRTLVDTIRDAFAFALKTLKLELGKRKLKESRGEFRFLLENFASCSFTTNPIDRLMWAHYADSYKGFCVGYEVDCESNFVHNDLWHRVLYTDQFPKSLILHGNIVDASDEFVPLSLQQCVNYWLDTSVKKEDKVRYVQQYVTQMLCIKAQEWVYEQEVRRIISTCEPEGEKVPWRDSVTIKEIILGSNISSDDISNLKGIINSTYFGNVSIYKVCTKKQNYFALDVTPYE